MSASRHLVTVAARSCSLTSLVIVGGVITGHLFGIPPLESWGGPVQMAFPTAVCILFNSCAIIILSTLAENQTPKSK